VLPDPGLIEEGMTYKDYKEQFDLSVRVADLFSATSALITDINNVLGPDDNERNTRTTITGREGSKRKKLLEIKKQLVTVEDIRYPQPMLSDQVMYLYSMISRSDQKPGKDAWERYEELLSVFESLKNQYYKIMD